MKPSKSPRVGGPHRSRSSKSLEHYGQSMSEAKQGTDEEREQNPAAKMTHPGIPTSASAGTATGQDAVGLEQMRRRMSEAMAQKQQMLASGGSTSPATKAIHKKKIEAIEGLTRIESSSDESVATGTLSTDSTQTVRPIAAQTPSYPFPRMQMRLNRGSSHRSVPAHKPFTLLSPTNEPTSEHSPLPQPIPEPGSSEVSTPVGMTSGTEQAIPEDPNYPTPDLYDMVLMLNAEPGLDMWWANTTDILSESYGAERASLALPGDITDLENVPWGQKATFNIYGSESGGLSSLESAATSDMDLRSVDRSADLQRSFATSNLAQRPPLQSRHSIAGVRPETSDRTRVRPQGPTRALSTLTPHYEEPEPPFVAGPKITRQSATPRTQSTLELEIPRMSTQRDTTSTSSILRCHVHRALQPLETEPDALLVRTGVASLFGKRKPVVLTRAYSDESAVQPPRSQSSADDNKSQASRASAQSMKTSSRENLQQSSRAIRAFDEYEQPEPSPWTQSPSPSPAARPDPEESPFFAQPSASIDEAAFEQNPPQYDYGATANLPLNAIGAEMSMTLIHIPLIQPVPARGALASTLRFPIAILSFLSSLNPYPRTLRHSLANLLPHLASSYSLAQQYSNLQDRSRATTGQRHGAAFGLGGTFSDEGSELELVAELSGQIAQEKTLSKGTSRQSSARTPHEEKPPLRESPQSSLVTTPLHEHVGMSPKMPSTPGRSGAEIIEGYFTAKRTSKGQQPRTPNEDPATKFKGTDKLAAGPKSSRKSGSSSARPFFDQPPPSSPRPGSHTSESDYGDPSTQLDRYEHAFRRTSQYRDSSMKDEDERPLPELISSLMLNAVPLQLFLAKPRSGDLVWTNRKFDAFRIEGNQLEGQRVKDPWKNVHPEDRTGLVKLWQDALQNGSQFTHYVRVKRFNSDSDFRWFVFRASTLLSNHGRLLYWVGSYLDVHEQYIKNLEASEREATMARDAKIRALADAIPQVLFEALEGEGIVSVNQQWHAYSGQSLDEARGLGFAKHVQKDDLHKCGILSASEAASIVRPPSHHTDSSSSTSSNRTAGPIPTKQKNFFAPDPSSLEYMIKQGSVTAERDENERVSYLTEIRLRSKKGEYRWFLVRLSKVDPGLLSSGKASWYGTCTDIEIRKALERELNQANEKVHSEMESKTKFFANMSHEIRTPLNGILGSMPWLVESTLDHEQRRTVDTIQNSANNLRELVDNILDVTKVEAGKMNLLPKWFHIRTLCEEVVDTVSSRAIERGLELNYTLDAKMPANVKGDPFRVRQILLNLLGNSVKFTEQGEVFMRCSIRETSDQKPTEPPTAFLCCDVIDTGRGFNEDDFHRLFKQFGQIGGGSNHDAGSGLGLFLSKQLVEMHGGQLTVTSQAGEGSTFSFFIRVEVAPPGTEFPSPQATGRTTRQRHSSSISGSSIRSQSDTKTPTMGGKLGSQQTSSFPPPGLSKFIGSPDTQSPSLAPSSNVVSPSGISPEVVPSSATQSVRSNSVSNLVTASTASSLVPTPESVPRKESPATTLTERQVMLDKVIATHPALRRSKSGNDGSGLAPEVAHPATYSVAVICPAEHARGAIKQHIEHVVPLQIPVHVTTLSDIGAFLELMNGPASPTFTHIVLDLPASSDIMLFMRQMTNFTAPVIPTLIVVTDHYQKRDILEDFQTLVSTGRKAYMIHKPVKPSVFAMIFDPAQLRNLSKDRAREVAQTGHDDFKNMAIMVKDKIGNRRYRVLLVEDSDVNRMVIVRYLKKVALENEEAKDGQQCVDLVFGKPAGYYSLIICDIQMPRKNGYEACIDIRSWERENGLPPCPIMALTANAMPEERSAAAAAGFTDYLTKPVDFNVLGTMMMSLLDPKVPHVFLRDRPVES